MYLYDLEHLESVSLLSAGKIGKHFWGLAIFLLDNFAFFFGSLQGLLFRFRNSIFEINFLYAVLNLKWILSKILRATHFCWENVADWLKAKNSSFQPISEKLSTALN